MIPLAQLIRIIAYLTCKTQIRVIAVEVAARLSIRGAESIRNEISLYRAYLARRRASLPQPQSKPQSLPRTLKFCAPRRSDILLGGSSGSSNLPTSEGRFPRWAALVGLTAAQLAVAYKWPLEDSGEAEAVINSEATIHGEEQVGVFVKSVEHLADVLEVKHPEIELPDLAMEFWEDFAQDLQA